MTRTPLLDVNVLLALAWPNHVHHRAARRWFRAVRDGGWATCPITQAAFIRVSSNSRVFPEARSPREAALLLRRLVRVGQHVFWEDDIDLTDSPWIALENLVGYRQVTDAHLLAVALSHGGSLATFDRGVKDLLPAGIDAVEALVHLEAD